jgi:membrane protein DedA with SNARE-associated domain
MSGYLQNVVDYVRDLPALTKLLTLIFSVAIEYVFPIFPGDTIVLLAGFLHARGAIDLFLVMTSVIVGSILGAYLGYQIGFHLMKKPYKYLWAERIANSAGYTHFNVWYKKWGAWLLLFNRFIHGIRAVFFIAAGASRLPVLKVVTLGTLSAIIFNGCLIVLGYWLGYDTERILTYFYRFNLLVYLFLAAVIGSALYWWRKKRS